MHPLRLLPPDLLRRVTLSRATLHALIDLALTTEGPIATNGARPRRLAARVLS